MSNRNSEHPGSVRPHAEPLDDIILEGDDDTAGARRGDPKKVDAQHVSQSPPRKEPSRAPPPSAQSEDVKKTQRQNFLRIPDDEVARPNKVPYIESEPRVPVRHAQSFDPESTVKMSALELDSSAELPPQPHERAAEMRARADDDRAPNEHDEDDEEVRDDDSWTPLQPLAEEDVAKPDWAPHIPSQAPSRFSDEEHPSKTNAMPPPTASSRMRSEMPTPPPTSEEIPVALEDPLSGDSIPVAEPSSPLDLATRSSPAPPVEENELPPHRARTQTAPLPPSMGGPTREQQELRKARDSRDSFATQIDSAELGSIDVNFQSAPNFDALDGSASAGKAPLEAKVSTNDPPIPIAASSLISNVSSAANGPNTPVMAVAMELAPDDVVAVDSSPFRNPVSLPAQAPQASQPAPHGPPPPPPVRAKTQSTPSIPPQPPPAPPMRPKSASTPSVPPGTLAPISQTGAASTPTPSTPTQGVAAPAHSKPAKPPPPAAASHSIPTQVGTSAPAPAPSAHVNGGLAVQKPILIVPPGSEAALAPPPLHEARAQKRVRPWWEELFNDDFIRAMEKLTDPQIKRESDFIEDSLGVAKGAMVLDLACGTGRHAIEMSKRGYGVVGFDLSLAMLARAAEEADERNATLNFVQGDMREMTFEEMFDGIYSWNTSFGFFEEEKNANVIQRVHRALKKGGQFLLDVVNRDYVAKQAPSLVWFEGDGCVCMDEMSIDWITSRMKIKRTMMIEDGRSREIEFSMRLYALHELGKLLHDAGFRVAEVSGRTATPGVFFGADSPRTIILAEKRV